MALDFDESAAQPVAATIAELRSELGLSGETTPPAGNGKQAAAETPGAVPAPPSRDGEPGDESDTSDNTNQEGDTKEESTTDDEKEASGEQPDPLAGYSPGIRKIIETKYKGDVDAFEKGIFEQQNSLSAFSKTLKGLEEKIAKLTEETEPEYDLSTDPDIKTIEGDIASYQSEIADNTKEQLSLVNQGEKINLEIAKLQGKMEASVDDQVKEQLERSIESKRDKVQSLAREWKTLEREKVAAQRSIAAAQRQRASVETRIKEQLVRQSNSAKDNQKWLAGQQALFDEAVNVMSEAKKLDDEDTEYLRERIVSDFHRVVNSMPDPRNAPPIDVVRFVKERAQYHIGKSKLGASNSFVSKSANKIAATPSAKAPNGRGTAPAKQNTGTPAPSRPRGQQDAAKVAQEARAHAARVLGG